MFRLIRGIVIVTTLIVAMPVFIAVVCVISVIPSLFEANTWSGFKREYNENIRPLNPFSREFWQITREIIKGEE